MAENKPVPVTDESFKNEVVNADVPVLVDFWAAWCGPCRMIAPMIEELAREFDGRAKITKMDVDNNPQVAMQFGIRSIPTLLFFKDGEVVDQLIGASSKKTLADKLEALVSQPA
jgi:thioredoxin 1